MDFDDLDDDSICKIIGCESKWLFMYALVNRKMHRCTLTYLRRNFPSLTTLRDYNAAMIIMMLTCEPVHSWTTSLLQEFLTTTKFPLREFTNIRGFPAQIDRVGTMHYITCVCLSICGFSEESHKLCSNDMTNVKIDYNTLTPHAMIWDKIIINYPELSPVLLDLDIEWRNSIIVQSNHLCKEFYKEERASNWTHEHFNWLAKRHSNQILIDLHLRGCPFGGICFAFACYRGRMRQAKWLLNIGCRIPRTYARFGKFIRLVPDKKI